MPEPVITHCLATDIEVRECDGKKTYAFTAATERAVDTPFGPEVLRMSGVNLKRYRSNPVVLDTHNRGEVAAIVGRAVMKREGDVLAAEIEFANTERAQIARQLADDGFLRTVSVGFIPRKVRNLRRGEVDGTTEGPVRLVTQWELVELSLVPVPADAEALARSHYFGAERQKATDMHYPEVSGEPVAESAPATPAAPEQREAAPPAPAPEPAPLFAEREQLDAYIRRLGDMVGLADEAAALIVRGASLTEARAELTKALTERSKPVGTPEPTPVPNSGPVKPSVDAETLRDSFKRL